MKLNDMLAALRHGTYIEIRNKENNYLCEMVSNSVVIKRFADKEVYKWLPCIIKNTAGFAVLMEEDNEAD